MERRSEERVRERRWKWIRAGAIGAVLGFGLFPVDAVDRVASTLVGWLSLPQRGAAWVESWVLGEARAAEPERAGLAAASAADLRNRELATAVANQEELRARGGVVAAVSSRETADATYEINRGKDEGVVPGQPVTCGDAFAGIVASTDDHRAVVYFPWHRAVRLCARTVEQGSVRVVVAGAGDCQMRAVVSQLRPLRDGAELVVAKPNDESDLQRAEGFRIGSVKMVFEGLVAYVEVDPNIRSDRLLQVVVHGANTASGFQERETPARWEAIALAPGVDAAPGRLSALAGGRGALREAQDCAVAIDRWLVGRAARAGGGALRVRLFEDPGFVVRAILLPQNGAPIPIRRLKTRRASGDSVVLTPVDGLAGLPADASGVLVTGPGDPTVPKGLRIGLARVAAGEVVVDRAPIRPAGRAAWVYLPPGRS